ncbi:hypothetical protein PNA2_0281 [Pyrococcus sp. NA2]|uniref:hypothetical protein n=1 Tax=Pyrococcus sp. (strain NA2) TaxID=342949 RepID=UPI000209B032|nr:hypothetical protein [Pyrococcus sp. NA2]AEC51199.1 hypothetical protein PNA2_0281 [Pyrococcus sp. NA2]
MEGLSKANAIALTPNGDIVIVGLTNSSGADKWDVLVMKLDGDGNLKWARTYGGSWKRRCEVDGEVRKIYSRDWANGVALSDDGDIIAVGTTSAFLISSSDYLNVWILRLPFEGELTGCEVCTGLKARIKSQPQIPVPSSKRPQQKWWDSGAPPSPGTWF